MNCLSLMLLFLVVNSTIGQTLSTNESRPSIDSSRTMITALYRKVVIRHPYSLPEGANTRIFSPYLSRALVHKIQSAQACSLDWSRQNEGKMVKAPFAWSELGIFSGRNEKDSPAGFQIEKVQAENDGSVRADVSFTYRPADGPGTWHVAVILTRENGHPVVEDIVYLKDQPGEVDERLSEVLADGCDGSRWVGKGGHQH